MTRNYCSNKLRILEKNSIKGFAQGALEQLAAILYLEDDVFLMEYDAVMAKQNEQDLQLIAAVKQGNSNDSKQSTEADLELFEEVKDKAKQAENSMIVTDKNSITFSNVYGDKKLVLCIKGSSEISNIDYSLIELFCKNVSIALENIELYEDVSNTQKDIIYSVCELAESRSKETGNHVRRVAMYSKLMAEKHGLTEHEVEELYYASPLHDVGKVAIPDNILNKPGPLEPDEWEVMKTHAEVGFNSLRHMEKPIFQAGAIIAGQHHENWDGSGYPNGYKGEDIHIYGRITAVADVFDALMSKRCYKPAWAQEDVNKFITEQKGIKFDPKLVEIFEQYNDEFVEIFEQYRDEVIDQA